MKGPGRTTDPRPALITGGAGFIGTNLAERLAREGRKVLILDSLARAGVKQNLDFLRTTYPQQIAAHIADIRDRQAVREVVREAGQVYHFAAQVAVTTSLTDPVLDFEVNACGTLNVLEALRELAKPPPLVFTSTNKVYGALHDLRLTASTSRYVPEDAAIAETGIGERAPLDFHSPYGCSKGAADSYVLDYARTYGLLACVLRMSCIYGPHQFGTEDQGWVAHFLIRALMGEPITIYGDGRQVRDVLYVDDLIDALLVAQETLQGQASSLTGQAFNIGGGVQNTLSLLELIDTLQALLGAKPDVRFEDWRAADQKYYVSDVSRFRQATGWVSKTPVVKGVERLASWLKHTRSAEPSVAAR